MPACGREGMRGDARRAIATREAEVVEGTAGVEAACLQRERASSGGGRLEAGLGLGELPTPVDGN